MSVIPKEGDRVKVTIESTVRKVARNENFFSLVVNDNPDRQFQSHVIDVRPEGGTVTVEVIQPPWQAGDVLRHSGGKFLRVLRDEGSAGLRWFDPLGEAPGSWRVDLYDADRDTEVIIRGGKPVNS